MACTKSGCRYRKFAITLQVIIYTANATAWIISILAFTCGFVIGLGNDTIQLDLEILDLAVTTPATIFISYGLLLTLVTSTGCFSSISAKLLTSIFYVILIISYFLFDVFNGLWLLILNDSLINLHEKLNKSMSGYGDENAQSIGIIPLPPTIYWNHLQTRGKCCGLDSFEDWRKTHYGQQQKSIPDSCCSDDYSHRFCGSQVFKHPDTENHLVSEILHKKGCMQIFPEAVRLTTSKKLTYIGRFVGCLLLVCGLLTLVIIVLVLSKKFRPEQGLDNLEYVETRKGSLSSIKDNPTVQQDKLANTKKVHPAAELYESGDRRRSSDTKDTKRVVKTTRFKESGPSYIPNYGHEHEHHKTAETQPHPRQSLTTMPIADLRAMLYKEYTKH